MRPSSWPVLLLAAAIAAAPAEAQFSPGPLSKSHESLSGNRNCLKCHGLNKDDPMDAQCLACHREIARLVGEKRGLHAGVTGECSSCHMEHAGPDFDLVDRTMVDPARFDHATAGWPLVGKHAAAKCEACHRDTLRISTLLRLLPGEPSADTFLGLERECASCHADPHEKRFPGPCSDCHAPTGWHDVAREKFDHSKARYALRGAHAEAKCEKCHDPETAWGRRPAFDKCAVCHGDAHGPQLAAGDSRDCSVCHDEKAFRPSLFTPVGHDGTTFPLRGRHVSTACAKCHPKNPVGVEPTGLGKAGVLLRAKHGACADCHDDVHKGQFKGRAGGDGCETCHTPEAWRPSRYTVVDHRASRFPLEGRHEKTECRKCHGGGSAEAAGRDPGSYRLEDLTCTGCHADPHDGRYAAAKSVAAEMRLCADCHGPAGFRPARVDGAVHNTYSFPLDGAHRAVPCVRCHEDLRREPAASTLRGASLPGVPLTFTAKHEKCADCHQDPHAGQFTADCSRCHEAGAFRPAGRFDHTRDSSFSLAGAHVRVRCEQCHKPGASPTGKEVVIYRPLSKACESCHAGGVEGLGAFPAADTVTSPDSEVVR